MWVLWLAFAVSVIGVAVPQWLYNKATSMAKRGEAGSEYVVLVFAPLFLLMPLFMVTGTFSATGLALNSHGIVSRTWWTAVAAGFGVWMTGTFIAFLRTVLQQRKENREYRRILSQEEMIGLIRSCAIRRFMNQEDGVSVTYVEYRDADGNYVNKPHRADPDGYRAYVAAADEAHRLGAEITYHDLIDRDGSR